ncbi:MAG: sodium:proton antiporter [Lachnospiraceae bacterium]|nr:sodium:proton antiporter [Lachnospiraceae bacterium]
MNSGILALEHAYRIFLLALIILLAIMLLFCFLRACLGPKVADRIVAINMMGTIVMVIIAVLAVFMKEGYLVDICLIYAMISFLAVIVLTKVYMGVYLEKKQKEKEGKGNGNI